MSALDGPVFEEAWQAEAFALATMLQERGHFTAAEWTAALGAEIATGSSALARDGRHYYDAWLAALEKITVGKGLVGAAELTHRKSEWDRAAKATPHGQPIELGRSASESRPSHEVESVS